MILLGSDLDRIYFIQALEDGILNAVSDLTLYISRTDSALGMSRFVFGRERIGQFSEVDAAGPRVRSVLMGFDNLHIIDASEAEGADTGNGHWYFRASPWASSDLFLSLLTDKAPSERGLIRPPDEVVWKFPSNYVERISSVEF